VPSISEPLTSLQTGSSPAKVKPLPTAGYLYLYAEDELLHLCWRPRNTPSEEPELDLLMLPTDGSFTPYHPTNAENPSNAKKATNGRIYVLKFSSTSQRYLFWLQSRSQHPNGDPSWFSARDLKLGQIVNNLLQGEEVDVEAQMASIPSDQNPDDDEPMEDVEGTGHDRNLPSGGGGAGADATGGDIREEGEPSREGGADGGRA
jgi:26S proteasome regulatory subunit N13